MASKWNQLLPLAVTFTLCVLLPRWLAAADSNTNTTNNQTTNATTSGDTGTAGQITGSERFLRENREAGQMVGGDVQGVGNLRGQTDGGSQSTSSMFGGQSGYSTRSMMSNLMNSGMFGSSRQQQRQQLRVPLRIGPNSFPFSSATPAVATGPNLRVQNRLARLPPLKDRGSVQVEMEGQVAVLRGAVTSQHERDLVARLVLLEPGIADVRNELQVGSATPNPVPKSSPKP
ncbi:MAG TPA: BON domain-containing protein [Candidatus Anammoximicrobium sp.]|nr:BON domain-containing protein [Candidatus Anammoximicrobium sp.]